MQLNPIFSNGAVLPAKKPFRIFGSGKGCATVELCTNKKTVVSEGDFWEVEFPPMEYGGPYTLTFECDGEKTEISDIYVGEVYLFAGQSNIAFMLRASNTPKEEYEELENLRLISLSPDPAPPVAWKKAKSGVIEDFSALGYLVGRDIAKTKGIAVGVIACSQGASVLDSWLPKGTLASLGISFKENEMHRDRFGEYGAWNGEGYLYNKKFSKLIPYAFTGAVWYQGESNAAEGEALSYERMLRELIKIWREKLRDENLPFTIVQLADTYDRMDEGYGWKTVQDAQEKVATTEKNTYLAICRDISENDDVHPMSKLPLAKRITEIILKNYN